MYTTDRERSFLHSTRPVVHSTVQKMLRKNKIVRLQPVFLCVDYTPGTWLWTLALDFKWDLVLLYPKL